MRSLASLLVLLLVACTEPGPQGPAGEKGAQGEKGEPGSPGGADELAALRAELDGVKAQLAAAQAVKTPHLIAEDGTDLGPFVSFSLQWIEPPSGYVPIFESPLVYTGDNCSGDVGIETSIPGAAYVIGPDETLLKFTGPTVAVGVTAKSQRTSTGCSALGTVTTLRAFADTGIRATTRSSTGMRIELR